MSKKLLELQLFLPIEDQTLMVGPGYETYVKEYWSFREILVEFYPKWPNSVRWYILDKIQLVIKKVKVPSSRWGVKFWDSVILDYEGFKTPILNILSRLLMGIYFLTNVAVEEIYEDELLETWKNFYSFQIYIKTML